MNITQEIANVSKGSSVKSAGSGIKSGQTIHKTMSIFDVTREKYLQKKYKISSADYEHMLVQQENRCAICRRLPKARRLSVDHDHKTGKVRGLLCYICNRKLIGRYRFEHAWIFLRASEYLKGVLTWPHPFP